MSDLLDAAAERLFDGMKLDRSSVDALIVVTSSPDYHYPATACVLQGRLGLSEECSCFDVGGLACSAYVHGLWLAHSLVESGAANRCLVLAGDLTSTHSDRRNRNSNMLFGDAGTATLVERTEDDCPAWFIIGTRGSGWNTLIAPAGGYALPVRSDNADLEIIDETGNVWRMYDDIMKGMSVFKFTTDVGPKGIAGILEMSGKTKDDMDYFAIHQANKQIVRTVANFAGLPKGKFSADAFAKYGNCGAAAVTMELVNRLERGALKDVCLATFGVGTSISFETSQKMKNLLGYNAYMINAYFLKTIPTLKDIKPRHARIEYDGQIIEDDFYFGAISNTISVAGMFQLDPEKVDLHDGKFELLLVRRVKRPTDAFAMLQKIRRKEYDNDSILLLQAENIKMTFDKPQDWSLDGEFCGGVTDVDFSVLPKAIRVLSPENALLKEKEESAISGEA